MEEMPPIKFADYRRYDAVYDGLFYGRGLHNIDEDSFMDGALSGSRSDYFASIQVYRRDLLAFFGRAMGAKRSAKPAIDKPRVGDETLRAWLGRRTLIKVASIHALIADVS